MDQMQTQPEKSPYEVAYDQYKIADQRYQELEAHWTSGNFLHETQGKTLEEARVMYAHLVESVQRALDDRNEKLKAVGDALRQKVTLQVSKWRGPEGKPTTLTVGEFKVSSTTRRRFDPKSLMSLCAKHGLLERLLELKGTDKDGKEYKLIDQAWFIDYEPVLNWLKANQLQDVIDGSYDEEEKTPTVKGPKVLAFVGDAKEK